MLVKISNGTIINLEHVVQIEKTNDGGNLYILGLPKSVFVTDSDYFALEKIAEMQEDKMLSELSFSPMALDTGIKMMTELMLHFVGFNIAVQNNTTDEFPMSVVYTRIAKILNQLDQMNADNQEVSEEYEEYEEEE